MKGVKAWFEQTGARQCSFCHYFTVSKLSWIPHCEKCPLRSDKDGTDFACCAEWRTVRYVYLTLNETDIDPVGDFNRACATMQAKIAAIKTREDNRKKT